MTNSAPNPTPTTADASPGESKAEASLWGTLPLRILAGLGILIVVGALALIPLQSEIGFKDTFGFEYTFVHGLVVVGVVVVVWVGIGLARRAMSKPKGAPSPGGDTF